MRLESKKLLWDMREAATLIERFTDGLLREVDALLAEPETTD